MVVYKVCYHIRIKLMQIEWVCIKLDPPTILRIEFVVLD